MPDDDRDLDELRAEVAAQRDELRLLPVDPAEEVRTRQVIVEDDFARALVRPCAADIHVGPWEDEVTPEVVTRIELSSAIETVEHRARGSS